jgi:hypothetical protein
VLLRCIIVKTVGQASMQAEGAQLCVEGNQHKNHLNSV